MRAVVALGLAVAIAGCGDNLETTVTWYGEVGAIVRTKCAGCHHDGGIAPFSLLEYGDAYEQMGRVADAVDTGIMPPWSTLDPPDCTPRHAWANDVRLTDAEREAIDTWVGLGGPEGAPRDLPKPLTTELSDPTITVAPPEPFMTGGTRDEFMCILLDPQIDHVQWITGSQVYPTAAELVHHVNVYLISPSEVDSTKAFTGGIGVPKLGCDHPPGLAIQSWLPGNPALLLPASVGIPVAAGTYVLLGIHYHPVGVVAADTTSLSLRTTDTRPKWRYELGVYGNSPGAPNLQPGPGDPTSDPVFLVPANATDHVEQMLMHHSATLDRELRVMSVTPHMHFLGTHERALVTHPNGDTECLIDSGWSFDWQRTYAYDAPLDDLPLFDPLSVVDLSCHWNNSFSNPMLQRLLDDHGLVAPYDVPLGFTTADEMCLADFGIAIPY